MSHQDVFDHLLVALHDATMNEALWPSISALIDQACGTKGSYLLYGKGKLHKDVYFYSKSFCLGGELRKDIEEDYFNVYYPVDERVPRIKVLPDSKVTHVSDLYTDQEKSNSLAYNEMLPLTQTQDSLIVRLEGPGLTQIVWNIADPSDGYAWRSSQIEFIQRLLPHIRHYVNMRQALADAESVGSSLFKLLDNKNYGIILLDRHGQILEANDFAGALLRRGDALCQRERYLMALDSSNDVRLQNLLKCALPKLVRPTTGGSVSIERICTGPSLVLYVSPVNEGATDYCSRSAAAIVLVVDPAAEQSTDPELVRDVLGLTRAESTVAVLLASGLTIQDIAVSTGRQESTIRWHMKQIFQKQRITRQAQLVRRVQTLSGFPH